MAATTPNCTTPTSATRAWNISNRWGNCCPRECSCDYCRIHLLPATREQHELAVTLLRETDEDAGRIRSAVENAAHAVYLACNVPSAAAPATKIVGAAVVHWHDNEGEILYIEVVALERGKGIGRAMLALLDDEARRHGVRAILVGTANASLENIAFYQKCGYRMHHVRQAYFDYFATSVYENGIRIQDMLVFRRVVNAE